MANAPVLDITGASSGMVDTPFFDTRPNSDRALQPDDVPRAVLYALSPPPHVEVNEVLVRPVHQLG